MIRDFFSLLFFTTVLLIKKASVNQKVNQKLDSKLFPFFVFHSQLIYFLSRDKFHIKKQPLEVFYRKSCSWKFAILTGKHLCWSLFLIKGLMVIVKNTYFEEHLRTAASEHPSRRKVRSVSKMVLYFNVKLCHTRKKNIWNPDRKQET